MFADKWRDRKVHFVRLDTMCGALERLNVPEIFNLISDPKELYNLVGTDQSVSWILPPVFERVVAFQHSLIGEPPIQLGTPDPYVPAN